MTTDASRPIFEGCIPALMTPCDQNGTINYDALVETAQSLMADGMRGVVYCGSMGDWPLLTDDQRMEVAEPGLCKTAIKSADQLGRSRRTILHSFVLRCVCGDLPHASEDFSCDAS